MEGQHQRSSDNTLGPYLDILGTYVGAFLAESLLYGIHLVLFCICVYILATRRNPAQLIILFALIVMFMLATADIAVSYRFLIRDIPAVLRFDTDLDSVLPGILLKHPLFVTNNLIADGLLLYRCYMIWGRRLYVVLASGALLVADTVLGYLSQTKPMLSISATFTPVFLWTVFAFNIVMTAAAAGRIWWVSRAVRPILGEQQSKRYHTAIAILVESGAIYPISILIAIAIPEANFYKVQIVFVYIAMRVVGIVPALMIVQVELKRQSAQEQSERSPIANRNNLQPLRASITTTPSNRFSMKPVDRTFRRASINFPIEAAAEYSLEHTANSPREQTT